MTFAGSPERVEARLVAEAGYPFDPFRGQRASRAGSGRNSSCGWSGDARAVRLPRDPRARRPDVVLGGGGYVAGPMVLAAWQEADPGCADRGGRASRASRTGSPRRSRSASSSSYPRPQGSEVPRRRAADPRGARPPDRTRRARALGLPPDGQVLLVAGAQPGARALNELAVEAFGDARPGGAAPRGRARLRARCARASRAPTTARAARRPRRRARRGRSRVSRARAASVWELAAAGRRRSSSRIRTRRRTTRRRTRALRARRRRGRRAGDGARRVPELVRSLLADAARLAAHGRARCARSRGRTRPRTIAEELIAACRRLRAAASGSSGSAAPGCRAYALLARAWGAEVGGWDRVETPYLAHARAAIEVVIAPEPVVPDGWEVVVSTAYADRSRARRARSCSPSSSRCARSIVVAGAHGKTTTTAMIAFVPRPARARPGVRRSAARSRSSAGTRAPARAGSSSRATSRTARSPRCGREIAVVAERRPRPPHRVRVARGGARRCSRTWLAHVPERRARRGARAGRASSSRCPASTTGGTRLRRSLRSSSPASTARRAEAALREFAGVGRRFELAGRRRRARLRRLRAQPGEGRSRARRGPRARARAACSSCSSRISTRARDTSRTSSRASLARADAVAVTDVYAAREEPTEGVTGKLVVDALAERRPGMPRRRGRRSSRTARASSRVARGAGDVVLTLGAGDVDRGRAAARSRRSREDRGGRPARAVHDARHRRAGARVRAAGERSTSCEEALRWAAEHDARGRDVVGLGSNLLVADEGVDALVLKLGGELATVEVDGELVRAGGGAANAVVLHRARDAGLGGFEFACAIPGTIGGGVWMNAGAYGGDFAQVLERALVVDARRRALADAGRARPALPALGARARAGRRAGRAAARAAAGRRDQGDGRRAPGAAQGRAADEQAHVRQRLQEPRPRALRRADARGVRASRLPHRRRADLAAPRELHRERRRGRDGGRGRA